MNKLELIQKITNSNYNKNQLLGWVKTLPGESKPRIKPSVAKIGDVHMHPIFRHPIVLCAHRRGVWYGIMLTTETKCDVLLEPCKSRFFEDSYFTTTITGFKELPMFMGTYDNSKHLREVFKRIKKLLQ